MESCKEHEELFGEVRCQLYVVHFLFLRDCITAKCS